MTRDEEVQERNRLFKRVNCKMEERNEVLARGKLRRLLCFCF